MLVSMRQYENALVPIRRLRVDCAGRSRPRATSRRHRARWATRGLMWKSGSGL